MHPKNRKTVIMSIFHHVCIPMTQLYAPMKKMHRPPICSSFDIGEHRWSEAAKAVAVAGGDKVPLSQEFRDHLWVDHQVHSEAEFDVALSFFNVNVTTGEKTYEHHNCKVGLALHGKANGANAA